MDSAEFDDRLAALVHALVSQYERDDESRGRDRISRTQLAALVSHTESVGADGLVKLVKHQRAKGAQNEQATAQDKGKERARNPVFWATLQQSLAGELGKLAEEHGTPDLVHALFAARLASEINYRTSLAGGDRNRRS